VGCSFDGGAFLKLHLGFFDEREAGEGSGEAGGDGGFVEGGTTLLWGFASMIFSEAAGQSEVMIHSFRQSFHHSAFHSSHASHQA
jgi:hypothetical protein